MADKKFRPKRNRATVLAVYDGKLLLVRERGAKRWSLPGGGVKKGENPVTAARREVDEETGLTVLSAAYLFHYESPSQHHHVCSMSVAGQVSLQREELSDFRWWNGQTQLAIIPSATEIIEQARGEGYANPNKLKFPISGRESTLRH